MNFHDKNENTTTCIFGDKKSGRTTLLNFLLSEADKYMPTTLYIMDDMDSGLYVKARGGQWFQRDKNIINPLLCSDTSGNRQYLLEFFKIIAKHYFDPLKEVELASLKLLCDLVFQTPMEQRKLSAIISAIKDQEFLVNRFSAYLEGGVYYEVFERQEPLLFYQGQVTAINLQDFDDAEYTKNHFPKEKKLIEQFEYDLNSRRAVKAAIVLAAQNMMQNGDAGPKIFAVDNFAELVNLKYYQHLLTYMSEEMSAINGVSVFTIYHPEIS